MQSRKTTGLVAFAKKHGVPSVTNSPSKSPRPSSPSIESEGVMAATVQDFDILFDRGEGFALPPSMLDDNHSLESVNLNLPEEAFGNVWADQTAGGRR